MTPAMTVTITTAASAVKLDSKAESVSELGGCGNGTLAWGGETFACVSGPHGNSVLPKGVYTVRTRHVVVGGDLEAGFEDTTTKERWFIPIEPDFETSRDGLGIHPDGNTPGTLGCLGLQQPDAGRFWKKWNDTPLSSRPVKLTVHGATADTGGPGSPAGGGGGVRGPGSPAGGGAAGAGSAGPASGTAAGEGWGFGALPDAGTIARRLKRLAGY